MNYLIFATDKPGMLETRIDIRQKHRRYLRQEHSVNVLEGGPTLCHETGEMNGTLLIVDAESLEQVQEFVQGDPYSEAGLFENIDIRRWQSVKIVQGEEI